MNRKFNLISTLIGVFLFISVLSYDFRFSWLNFLWPYIKIVWIGLGALILLGIIILGLLTLFGSRGMKDARKRHPNFFEEMQSALQTILFPLGFEKREGSDRSRYIEFSREGFSVWLTLDIMDSIYYVTASSKSETADAQKTPEPDFTVECTDLRKADEFKSESIAKLNEWLVKKRVR